MGRAGLATTGSFFEFLILEGAQAGPELVHNLEEARKNYRERVRMASMLRKLRSTMRAKCAGFWRMRGSFATA